MLAYTANTPKAVGRAGSPTSLALILIGHAAMIAAVLTARPEIMGRVIPGRTTVVNVPVPPTPKTVQKSDPQPRRPMTQDSFIERERPIIDMDRQNPIEIATGPSMEDIGKVIGSGPITVIDAPRPVPVTVGARLATSGQALKPPYPNDKLRAEEEATLRLRLAIDARGRVTAVDPVGAADPSFLDAARRHILRAWRYRPATEDGVAVPTTTLISLSFRLEDV